VATLSDQDGWPATDVRVSRHRSRPTMPRGQMRIGPRFKQVQSRSRAACSTDAIHAHLLPSLPTSLNADGREPIWRHQPLRNTRSCSWWSGRRMAESAPFSLRAKSFTAAHPPGTLHPDPAACRSGLFRRLCRTGATGRLGGYLVQPAAQAQHVRPLVPTLLMLPRDVRRATDKQQVQASAKAKPRHSGYPAKHRAGYPAKHRDSPAHR
jgi:hypothetical protein